MQIYTFYVLLDDVDESVSSGALKNALEWSTFYMNHSINYQRFWFNNNKSIMHQNSCLNFSIAVQINLNRPD
jgi:hypothetical protein